MSKNLMADAFRTILQEDGRSLYRLQEDTGIPRQVLGRFLRGERDLTLDTASRLGPVLGWKKILKKISDGTKPLTPSGV